MQSQKSKIWFSAILYFIFPRQSNLLQLQPWGLSPCIYYSPKSGVQNIHSEGKLLIKCGFSNRHSITVCQEHEENQFSGSLTMRTPFFFPQHPASFTESYSPAEIKETGDLNSFLSVEVAGHKLLENWSFLDEHHCVVLVCSCLVGIYLWQDTGIDQPSASAQNAWGCLVLFFCNKAPSPAFLPPLKFSSNIPSSLNPYSALQVLGPVTWVQAL